MELQFQISQSELIKIFSEGVSLGIQKGLEYIGEKPKYISQNKAYTIFGRRRVENWVELSWIQPVYNGRGKRSTINYEFTKLQELDISGKIVIFKSNK